MKRLAAIFRKRRWERELDEEVRGHLALLAEDYVRRGMDPASALQAARRSFGGIEAMKENYRDRRSLPVLETLLQDLRYALRQLRRSPGFTAVALITLALGIGANTAIFSVIEAVMLRPLAYRDAGRLFYISDSPDRECFLKDFNAWKSQSRSFTSMAVFYKNSGLARVTLTGSAEPEMVTAGFVSADLFPLLGVAPLFGRVFTAQEESRRERAVVLSHRFWMRRFGASADVLGRTLEIDGAAFTVIGVMPGVFQFPDRDMQFWAPITTSRYWQDPAMLRYDPNMSRGFYARWNAVGRLREGVSAGRANAELELIRARLAQSDPDPNRGGEMHLTPVRVELAGNTRLALWVLSGAVCFVLLIACSNVANLVLARGAARTREIGVRAALGASRGRIARQLFTESAVLALAAGALGLGLASFGIQALIAFGPPDIPRLDQAGVNAGVLVFTLAASLAAAVLFGLAPAWRIARSSTYASIKSPRVGVRGTLVAAEFALSVVLLAGAGLLIRSFLAVQSVDAGFDRRHVLTLRIGMPAGTPNPRRLLFHDQVLQRLRAIPGVEAAGGIDDLFELGGLRKLGLRAIEGRDLHETPQQWTELRWKTVSGDYFRAMGARLIRGRFFNPRDGAGSARVVVIDESMARRYWPGADPVGQRIKGQDKRGINDEWATIVGVAGDMRRHGLEYDATPHVFVCYPQSSDFPQDIVIRTSGDPTALAAAVRGEVRAIDRTAILSRVSTIEQELAGQLAPRRFQTWMLGIFSTLALALATIGIYGVMHYAVSCRTHEIGIRMAIGARSADVLRLVLRQGLRLAAAGIAAGLLASWFLTRLMSGLLFGIRPDDPVTFAAVSCTLGAVAAIASLLPACRAARTDPVNALRHE